MRRLASLALSLTVAVAGCGGAPPPAPNVLLIVVDTLGAGHLGCYGGPTRTPHVDALAAGGVRFERALSTAPWTMPSVASLLTGRMPSRHGVRSLNGKLPEDELTLAELLRERGYATHGVVSHFLIGSEQGYAQGFDAYDASPVGGHEGITSKDVTDRALEFLDARAAAGPTDRRPFLLLAHYFDPHFAYHHHGGPFVHTPDPVAYGGRVESGMDIWALRDMRGELATNDIEYLRGLYREEIAWTDHQVGRLLDRLTELGLSGDTLVVFTADHGEELMEHGWIGHTRTLYDDLLRVPLIVSLPGRIPQRVVATPVSLVDVLPTVAQLCGVPALPTWEGVSLVPTLVGGAPPPADRPLFAEVSFGRLDPDAPARNPRAAEKAAHKTMVAWGSWKLIHDERAGTFELYDLAADPDERRDLWEPGLRDELPLVRRLAEWEAARGAEVGAQAALTPAELDELRKLGYVR